MLNIFDKTYIYALLSISSSTFSLIDVATDVVQFLSGVVAIIAGYYAICLSKEKIKTEINRRKGGTNVNS